MRHYSNDFTLHRSAARLSPRLVNLGDEVSVTFRLVWSQEEVPKHVLTPCFSLMIYLTDNFFYIIFIFYKQDHHKKTIIIYIVSLFSSYLTYDHKWFIIVCQIIKNCIFQNYDLKLFMCHLSKNCVLQNYDWKLFMKVSVCQLSITLEKVIKTVSCDNIYDWKRKWIMIIFVISMELLKRLLNIQKMFWKCYHHNKINFFNWNLWNVF